MPRFARSVPEAFSAIATRHAAAVALAGTMGAFCDAFSKFKYPKFHVLQLLNFSKCLLFCSGCCGLQVICFKIDFPQISETGSECILTGTDHELLDVVPRHLQVRLDPCEIPSPSSLVSDL